MLSHDFPYWKNVYSYFLIWRLNGIWEHMNAALRTELGVANGREQKPSAAILDIQSVKTTETPRVCGNDVKGFQVLPIRWVVERTF
jgi:putative transposase